MRGKNGIVLFGFIEIAIGSCTLGATFQSLMTGASRKPPNLIAFVIISSLISLALGAGVILKRRYARKLLVFFAGWIILSKLLIAMGILTLCCALETTIAPNVKNAVSIVYHAAVMLYFHHPLIKAEFET